MDLFDVLSMKNEDSGPELGDSAELREQLIGNLNEPQRTAVLHERGPLLILAGPGSGKTRVITQRIAWLVQGRGYDTSEILAITFTNKAAREMRERISRELPEMRGLWISTFHSMCARILRREIEILGGWTRDFTIYDTADRNTLLKQILKDANFDTTRFKPAQVGGWISDWKNSRWERGEQVSEERFGDLYSEEALDDSALSAAGMEEEVLRRVQKRYAQALSQNNALDFDDLLLKTLEIFEKHPGVRDSYASRFRQVMVDEYQDTNHVQYLLTRHLANYHGNLAVCGDPDQSIYGWRGADVRNILDFERDFPGPVIVKLEQNYRSTNTILDAAQALIENNEQRKAKDLWSEKGDGEKICQLECGDEEDEAAEIVNQIRSLRDKGSALSEIAIFYRVNFMQRAIERALRLSGVPYHVVAGVEFFTRREIRDLVAYLKLIMNPADDIAFRRVVNVPARGVGGKSLDVLARWAADRRIPLSEACRSEEALSNIRGRAKKSLAGFAGLMDTLLPLRDAPPQLAVEGVLDCLDLGAWLGGLDDDGPDREANVEEFRAYAEEFDSLHPIKEEDPESAPTEVTGGLRGFLEEISLVSDQDGFDEDAPKVTLMTLHSAKGLEFPVVFIAGLEEELLPHIRSMDEGGNEAIEEERRLLYVGMTRAEERLFLMHAMRRMHFGQQSYRRPSRFLDELPPNLIEGMDPNEEDDLLGEFEAAAGMTDLAVGQTVMHDHFGRGSIEQLQGSGINARATVHFIQHGMKTLLLQYAHLKPVHPPGQASR